MQSTIIAVVLIGIVIISHTEARRYFSGDDSELDAYETLLAMKRGAPYRDIKTTSRCKEILSGKDHWGGDMDPQHPPLVSSPAACAALCEQYPDCTHWTFKAANGRCYIKDKATSFRDAGSDFAGKCDPTK